MSINPKLKQTAIHMRTQGKSYSEILKQVPVAKSTLGLWLKDVGLSVAQKQRLTTKRLDAVKRGGVARMKAREISTANILKQAKSEIGRLSERELFLIGVTLYWAEGSKQKPHNVSEGVLFSNSDVLMVEIFLNWLRQIGVKDADIKYSLYLHDSAAHRVGEIKRYWSKALKLRITSLEKIYFKRGSEKSFRKNRGNTYYGQMRVKVSRSTNLNRQISGWVTGICNQ